MNLSEAERIFHAALKYEAGGGRSAFLDRECGGDKPLRRKVERLLAALVDAPFFLSGPTRREAASSPGEAPGIWVGRYKLLEKLGEGGFGVVYLAEQRDPLKRHVALKIIKFGLDTKQVIARFEIERQALAMMDHPNIAKVFDGGATDRGRPYFVMELVRGIPITEHCDGEGLRIRERLELFMAVCQAVQHAHQKGIIHRDLKPRNILVTLQDGVPVPKVIDFGIAKATQQELTEATVFTELHQMIGTPSYMSPEQADMGPAGGGDIDTRSDIYALGVLLYELLIGRTPLDANELRSAGYDEMRRRIRTEEPLRPSTQVRLLRWEERRAAAQHRKIEPSRFVGELKGDLDWIVMKALEKDRTRRYVTAQGFADDIRRCLDHEAVEAARPTLAYRTQKFVRRHRVGLGVSSVFLGLLIGGTVVSTWQAIRAHRAETDAKSQTAFAQAGQLAARRALYVAELGLAQQSIQGGNVDRGIGLLKRQIPREGELDLRGFEWAFLWDRIQRHRTEMIGHTGDIRDIDISPNGRFLASASIDGTTRVWDLQRGEEVARINHVTADTPAVGFSPDGRLLATTVASPNGEQEILLWDTSTRREVRRLGGHPQAISCVRFAPDGATLLAGYANRPIGTTLSAGYDDRGGQLQAWDLSTQSSTLLPAHWWTINRIAFTRDGSRFVTCGHDDKVLVWDLKTLEVISELSGHRDEVCSLACAPDRELAVSSGLYGKLIVWDLRDGTPLKTLSFDPQRYGPPRSVEFSADGSILAVSRRGGKIHLLRTDDWTELASHNTGLTYDLAFSPLDGRLVSAGGQGQLVAMDFAAVESKGLLSDQQDRPRSLRVSPDGRTLAVGMATGSIRVWDLELEREQFVIPGRRVWQRMMGSPFDHHFFDYSPDGRTLATVTHTNQVDLWDVNSGALQGSIHASNRIFSLDWSPDGRRIAGGGPGPRGMVTFWSVDTLKPVLEIQTHHARVGGRLNALIHSPDGHYLVTTTWDENPAEKIKVWDVATGTLVAKLGGHWGGWGDVYDMVFSPDGSLLATAAFDRRILLWDTESWEQKAALFGHAGPVLDLSFSPDGSRLASGGIEGVIKLWDLATYREVLSVDGMLAEFAPRDALLVAATESMFPVVERTEPSKLLLHHPPSVTEIDRWIREAVGAHPDR